MRQTALAFLLSLSTIACFTSPCLAQANEKILEPKRPRIALVLSGGGARGIAHIGVLKALQELRVPVDMVVGTSMGAVVGGAFASGQSVEELEAFVRSADWDAILSDRAPRRELSFQRREDDRLVASRIDFGVGLKGVTLPPAAAGNSALEFTLTRLAQGAKSEQGLQQLPLPFRALATDLLDGKLVTLSDQPLFLAMRASMAVPGLFSPVRVDGRLVVDGGLVRNLGVDVARTMGADVIIAVNVGSPLLSEQELLSALSVTDQMVKLLTTQNVEHSLAELRPQDVLITPAMEQIGLTDFSRREQALQSGQQASLAASAQLQALALSELDYRRHEDSRRRPGAAATSSVAALPMGRLTIDGTGFTNPAALKLMVEAQGLKPGQPVTHAQINEASAALQGRGDFDRIDTHVIDDAGVRDVQMTVSEAAWARSRLRLGFEVESDFGRNNAYALTLLHSLGWINAWGAELRTLARVGSERELGLSFNQPLGPGSAWYLEPQFNYRAYNTYMPLFFSDLAYRRSRAGLMAGRRLGNWGDLQLGYSHSSETYKTSGIGVAFGFPDSNEATVESGPEARFRIDTLDAPAFPGRGYLLDLHGRRLSSGDQTGEMPFEARAMAAFQINSWAGHLYAEYAEAAAKKTDAVPRPRGKVDNPLGGFLRLSGSRPPLPNGASSLAFTRLVMAKQLAQMPVGLGGAVRAGFSLEAGKSASLGRPLGDAKLRTAASGFLAVDTRLGPFYLAYGGTRDGDSTVYFFLGPLW
ncbi:patatin-like phospholipase family protein [Paucibacter sp. B2R-40]|uniref:patatin-like phospholipase family protein n=1 Tax=Paucibacter sp. B2R-40 TaxID=2893554 RepID=UPI0021E37F10|nr:patatin-like phospholipase family protein [Paucibacter sp. B2R-40]MCV2354190.1 patatin-like phospholipase family protein [Paucibacter sp. B2R-40]